MKPHSKLKTVVNDILQISSKFLLDIFYPKHCVSCGKHGQFVCIKCVEKIEPVITSTCPECGKIIKLGNFCPKCKQKLKVKLSGIIISARYEIGPTREMIHHLKYSGFIEIADMLGELMVQRIKRENLPKNTLLVPVPLHKSRESERGFNQSELLAQYISKKTDIPYKNSLLRDEATPSQVSLSGTERRANLEGAFSCADKKSIKGKNILLVDDVTTTYSTLNECAKELISAGAKKVYGLVVARG